MERVSIFELIGLSIKGNGFIIYKKVRERKYGLMEQNLRGSIKEGRKMGMEFLNGLKKKMFIQGISRITTWMVMEYFNGKTGGVMKETGKTII